MKKAIEELGYTVVDNEVEIDNSEPCENCTHIGKAEDKYMKILNI